MRKPRDLDIYTDEAGALAFLDGLRRSIEGHQEGTLFKIKVEVRNWHMDWSKSKKS